MSPLTLEGHTLGDKHKNFNKLVQDTIAHKQFTLTEINFDDSDIQNLLKVDIACKTKNVDYVTEVLKCDDMLYVSKAIKQSTWLVTEQEYAHIVNPEYLHTQLFPHMLTKAINKLLLHIRLHLNDEKRTEAFYNYYYLKGLHNDALKWLLHCSIPFIENVIQNQKISIELYKRLCKRSVTFLKYYTRVEDRCEWQALKAVLFLLKSHTEEYLHFFNESKSYCNGPFFSKKHTEIIMLKYPSNILDNFEKYVYCVDLSTVARYMKKEDMKNFLYKQSKHQDVRNFFSNYENLKHFVKYMSTEDRFEYVNKIYIDESETMSDSSEQTLGICSVILQLMYQYTSFNVAFIELNKLICEESSAAERCDMLSILITCARNNSENTKILLQHYYDNHRNEPLKFKTRFVNNVITQMNTHEFDSETWNILDKLFIDLEVYADSENDVQMCLKAIILYKCLHNEDIPPIVTKKFTFGTFNKFQSKLNKEQSDKIFSYLLELVSSNIENNNFRNDSDFDNSVNLLKISLELLIDWKKDLKDYAFLLDKIRELIKVMTHDANKINVLSSLFNLKKSWRRYMFEESMTMCRNEEVCLNALKHDPDMLTRHVDVLDTLRTNPAVSLQRLLAKLRVYWTDTLAQQWTDQYFNSLTNMTGHKAILKGLLALLSQKQLIDIAKKYVPEDPKIESNDQVDQTAFNIRRNIANNLFIARPIIPFEVLLWYAEGDYLQFLVPSLNAVLYNISKVQARIQITKLLDTSLSIQNHEIHPALIKVNFDILKPIFLDIWKTTEDTWNSKTRIHIFTHTFNMLCEVKEPTVAKKIWELLSTFIDYLTEDENKIIFIKLSQVYEVHESVQGQFYMKSYEFLSSLPPRANCDNHLKKLVDMAPKMMDKLDADFTATKFIVPYAKTWIGDYINFKFISISSAFVLHGKSEDEQCERFRKVVAPNLEDAFKSWDEVKDEIVRHNIYYLMRTLSWDFKNFLSLKKIIPPVKLFVTIQTLMEQNMSIEANYIEYTSWKLTTEYVKLVAEEKDMLRGLRKIDNLSEGHDSTLYMLNYIESVWTALHIKVSPKFGSIIVEHLKKDTEIYFPTICRVFSKALLKMFHNIHLPNSNQMETLKYVLNENFIPSYLVVCFAICKENLQNPGKRGEIRKMLLAHPSKEVKMHYYRAFHKVLPDS